MHIPLKLSKEKKLFLSDRKFSSFDMRDGEIDFRRAVAAELRKSPLLRRRFDQNHSIN
jgi:hypothetical protein